MHLTNALHLKKPAWKRIVATTLTAALAITGAAILAAPAASAAPAATPPATQNVDATLNYTCNVFPGESKPIGTPEFPNQPISSEIVTTLPSSVTPGETIPKTPIKLVNDFTPLLGPAFIIGAKSASGGSPDVYSTFVINNKSVKSPLLNVTAPLVPIPQIPNAGNPDNVTWFDTATGTSSALTIPKGASGDILVQGPTSFTIESNLSDSTDGSNSFPTVLACTSVAGEDLDIARIHVAPAGAQNIDATLDYTCGTWTSTTTVGELAGPPPTAGAPAFTVDTTAEIKTMLPSSIAPGATIPAENITLTNPMSSFLAQFFIEVAQSGASLSFDGSVTGAALGVGVNGTTTSSTLQNMAIPTTPTPASLPFNLTGSGTTTPVVVPADASGAITISAPQQFSVSYTDDVPADGGAPADIEEGSDVQTAVCTADDPSSLNLASIQITPPSASSTLTATAPKSTVYGRAATVPVAVKATAAAAPPITVGGSQNIDIVNSYTCDVWENQTGVPTDGTTPNFSDTQTDFESKLTLPQSVRPGTTLPATDLAAIVRVPDALTDEQFDHGSSQDWPTGLDNLSVQGSLGISVDGQTGTSTINGLGRTDLAPFPQSPSNFVPWVADSTGTASAITVPANASGDLTISAPQQFDATFTVEPPAAPDVQALITAPMPVAMQCTFATATPQQSSTIATINVVGSATPKPAALPTGKVLITRNGKGVAQGTMSKGKANVVIPGTALPVGKSTLKVSYPGDSNTLAAPGKTITVVKTKASPTLAVHVTPGKVAAGAIFPTVNVKLTGPGKALGGKITVTAGSMHKTANLLFDGTTSVQFAPFSSAGHKLIRVSYAGNANFVAKTVTTGLNVTKTKLGKFAVKVKPGKILAKKTRATLLITLGAPDKLNHGLVTVRLAGHVIAKKLITGTGRITLPKFSSAGRKLLHLTFAGNGSVVARTITKAVKVTKRR